MIIELAAAKDPSQSSSVDKSNATEQEEKIKRLNEQATTEALMIRSKIEQLEAGKQEIEEQFEKQIKLLQEEQ